VSQTEQIELATLYEVDTVTEPVDHAEVIRYMGYPAGMQPDERLREQIERWVPEAEALAEPRATYMVVPVREIDRKRVVVDGPRGPAAFRGQIGEFLGVARYIAAFVATAGPKIEQLSTELLKKGEVLAGLVVSAVGSERAEAAEAAAMAELRPKAAAMGLTLTLPYSPGYCGMDIRQQIPLFELLGGKPAGVELSPTCLMRPIKSVSGLIGLGPPEEVIAYGSPCDRCELKNCDMRRAFTPQ